SLSGIAVNNNGVQSTSPEAIDHGRGLLDRTMTSYSRSIQQTQ
ncbi:unnamed protein product, partial [Adineta ricciae]